jgi:putative sterol carrier protein
MVKFLSQEWANALSIALTSEDVRRDARDLEITVQQIVTGTSQGEAAFWTTFDRGDVSAGIGRATTPDVTFEMDEDTAVALSRAELNHQAAFMQGKLKVTGNVGRLLKQQDALKVLGPVMASIATDY